MTNLPNDLSNAIIVRSSIAMAHSLGLTVVAEGAEDEVTCAMLADADCDSIQGYYLSKPMEPSRLQEWLLQGGSLEFAPSEIRIAPFGGRSGPGASRQFVLDPSTPVRTSADGRRVDNRWPAGGPGPEAGRRDDLAIAVVGPCGATRPQSERTIARQRATGARGKKGRTTKVGGTLSRTFDSNFAPP